MKTTNNYVQPTVQILEVTVESGFATSGESGRAGRDVIIKDGGED